VWHDLAMVALGGLIVFIIVAAAYCNFAKKVRW
jgi:hypothetical protein